MAITREQLLEAGARSLREFGYPDARPDNVMTVWLFAQFFKPMLEETRPHAPDLIDGLLAEIDALPDPSQ